MSDFVRHVIRIPATGEMLFDFGLAGARFRSIPDRDRWAAAWHATQSVNGWQFSWRQAPPWENWDRAAVPASITIWPRLEAVHARARSIIKALAKQQRLFRHRLAGARDGWLLRSVDDE